MRIVKEYDERRNEILDCAEKLFYTKGYEKATINDILKQVEIAKGTFYYYFKSKQEVLEAIVARYNDIVVQRLEILRGQKMMSPEEKLLRVFLSARIIDQVDEGMVEEMHRTENALMHQQMLKQMIMVLTPALAETVEEGNKAGAWNCKQPKEYMQIFLAAALTLTDDGIFEMDEEGQQKVMPALLSVLEKMLEVPEGTAISLYMKYRKGSGQ